MKPKETEHIRYNKEKDKYEVYTTTGDIKHYGYYYSEEAALKIVKLLNQADWDYNKLSPAAKRFFKQKGIQRKPQRRVITTACNYSYNSDRDVYHIQKYIDGSLKFIGYVSTETEAQKIVAALNSNGWNREQLPDGLKKLFLNKFRDEPTYYSKTPEGTYRITKQINGVNTYFGVYDTLEETEHMVELLKANNWDREQLPREFKHYRRNKNYYFRKDIQKYTIDKKIDGKNQYFGAYDTEEEAERMVQELDKVNWIIEDLPAEFKIIKNERKKAKYYRYDKNAKKWRIAKTINGKYTHFGSYETEDEAKKIVEILKANNWDKECLA